MKKYFYYILIIVVVINNYHLIKKYNANLEKLEKMKIVPVEENIQASVDYLYKIADSSYLDKIEKVDVSNEKLEIQFNILKSDKSKDIVENTEKILGRAVNKVSIIDDKQILMEFVQ